MTKGQRITARTPGPDGLNILQVCLSRSWGGLEMTALEQTQWLSEEGHKVLNVVRPGSPLKQKLASAGAPVIEARGCWDALRVRREAAGFRPDLIVHQQLRDLVYHRLYFPTSLPSVGFLHMFLSVRKLDPWHRFHYTSLDRLIVLTEAQMKNALDHLPLKREQIEIVPNGVDTHKFNPLQKDPDFKKRIGIDPSAFLACVVGRFDPQKGQMETLEALKGLRMEHPELHLLFVGEDTLNSPGTRAKMLEYIQAHDLQSAVHIMPFQDNIPSIMASVDLFIMPSYGETFGRVLIEAMASGVPVVGTRAGGVVSLIEDGVDGLLAEPRSSESLIKTLKACLSGQYDLETIRNKALKKVNEKFEISLVQQQIMRIYREAAQKT